MALENRLFFTRLKRFFDPEEPLISASGGLRLC